VTPDPRPDFDTEWRAELEDRAAELVERDRLLGVERDDRRAMREAIARADGELLERRATEWEACKARSGHPSDYGWRTDSPWSDAL
jgi:hypothetical protein